MMGPETLLFSADKKLGDLARLKLVGLTLRYNLDQLRLAWRLALTAATSVPASASLMIVTPALAEFEIQKITGRKGRGRAEYRGAVHWGFPESTNQEEEGEFLRQSHDLELQYGLSFRSCRRTRSDRGRRLRSASLFVWVKPPQDEGPCQA